MSDAPADGASRAVSGGSARHFLGGTRAATASPPTSFPRRRRPGLF